VAVGDVVEFEAEIEANIPKLRRFARAMVRDRALADDLVQDCLMRALTRRHLFQPGTNLGAWLTTILRNGIINHIRRGRTVSLEDEGGATLDLPAVGGNPTTALEMRDLSAALQALPDSWRELVLLVGLEGMSYEEAARVTGVNVGTVKSRLSRARGMLRALMDGQDAQAAGRTAYGRPPQSPSDAVAAPPRTAA